VRVFVNLSQEVASEGRELCVYGLFRLVKNILSKRNEIAEVRRYGK
jgi:hypothetical protein